MNKSVSDILRDTETNFRVGQEMAAATVVVVQKRLEILAGAVSDPFRADHIEINRMSTEKVEALAASTGAAGEASLAFSQTCNDIARRTGEQLQDNLDALSQDMTDAARLALQTEQVAQIWGQAMVDGMDLWSQSLSAQAKIMAPVHAAVTANAERLK